MTSDCVESSSSSSAIGSYRDGPPWVFKGRALYQLHAVQSSVARRFIPPELKLVEAFGYTLGGLFLAHYDGSPAGEFDEAVVIAGIVWNPPTSCAWAARILVSSEEARVHGRKEVGLPSHLANFSHNVKNLPSTSSSRPWWDARAWLTHLQKRKQLKVQRSLDIVQRDGTSSTPLCAINGVPDILLGDEANQRWRGLSVQLYLPNFSGKTKEQPSLLKYSCRLNCAVRLTAPARVMDLSSSRAGGDNAEEDERTRDVIAVLTGKPLVSLLFDRMLMHAEAPRILALKDKEKSEMIPDQGRLVPAPASTTTTTTAAPS